MLAPRVLVVGQVVVQVGAARVIRPLLCWPMLLAPVTQIVPIRLEQSVRTIHLRVTE